MREHLLKQALESGKTTSKKSKTKQDAQASTGLSRGGSAANSAGASPMTSRGGSRMGSPHGSDDEASGDEEGGGGSVDLNAGSIDGVLSGAAENLSLTHEWEEALEERIDNILNRSRRQQDQREADLKWYLGLTQNHYAHAEITAQVPQLAKQFLRAATSDSDNEAILALKCLSMTVFTDHTEDFYESSHSSLKALVQTADTYDVKAEALHALSVVVFVSGDLEYITDILPYLLEIIDSDGQSVEAHDSKVVVTAAIEAHQLLISAVDDAETLEELSQDTIEALALQLDSNAVPVLVAAGEAIALLYEKSYRPASAEDDNNDESDSSGSAMGPRLIQSYKPYRQTEKLLQRMTGLSRTSAKTAGRKDKTALKQTFDDAARSMKDARYGPRWTVGEGWKKDSKRDGGAARMKVRVDQGKGGDGLMTVDRWWKFVRVREVRRVVGQGFMVHWAQNEVVRECLTEP